NIYIRMTADARGPILNVAPQVLASLNCRGLVEDEDRFQVEVNHRMDRYEISHLIELGETVTVRLENPTAGSSYQWVARAPIGASTPEIFGTGEHFQFTPAVGGDHALLILEKRPDQSCAMARKSLFVT